MCLLVVHFAILLACFEACKELGSRADGNRIGSAWKQLATASSQPLKLLELLQARRTSAARWAPCSKWPVILEALLERWTSREFGQRHWRAAHHIRRECAERSALQAVGMLRLQVIWACGMLTLATKVLVRDGVAPQLPSPPRSQDGGSRAVACARSQCDMLPPAQWGTQRKLVLNCRPSRRPPAVGGTER